MSYPCSVSNQVVEFLVQTEGDIVQEIFYINDQATKNNATLSISVVRCTDDPEKFLLCGLVDIKNTADGFAPNTAPVEDLFALAELDSEKLPVFDQAHIGPLNAEETMTFLEVVHAQFKLLDALRNVRTTTEAFHKALTPDISPKEEPRPSDKSEQTVVYLFPDP